MKKVFLVLLIIFFTVGLFGQSLFDLIETGTPEEVQALLKAVNEFAKARD